MIKKETVDRALSEIAKGYAQYKYFFDHLQSPAWLGPLADRGFFQKPPEPIRDGQYISIAMWPESQYLIRMSRIAEAQETVLDIARRIPPSENSRVQDDIADIALSLKPTQSAKLVPQICDSIQLPTKLLLPEKVGDLIVHLAKGAQAQAALQLAYAALALGPDPRVTKEDDESILSPDPRSHFDEFYYDRIVDKAVPALVECSGIEAVKLFCELLDDAIKFSRKKEQEGDEDYLYIHHPAIEHGKDPEDIPTVLLCATRDAAQLLITARPALTNVLTQFQQWKWTSYRRLEMHIVRVFLEQAQEDAERIFQNPEILSRASLRHEAFLLLKAAFPQLTPETQERVLAWLDAGPSKESIRSWFEMFGEEVTDDRIKNSLNRRRLDDLSILEGQLPEPYRKRYEVLKAEFGPPNSPERVSTSQATFISAQSPKSSDELETMSVSEVVDFLKSWTPGHNVFEPTAEGLGVAFGAVVSQRPADFVAAAKTLPGLDPTYIRSLFESLAGALKQGVEWDWPPVLQLAKWVVDQGREITGRKGGLMDADPDWGWTRDAIINLLSAGFEDGPNRLPLDYRTQIWEVLRPLTEDPNPSLEDESGEQFEASFLSINSTRGRALAAVVGYAWWLRRRTDSLRKSEGQPLLTFEAMPEVREVLDLHLDPEVERTLTVRSIYGHHLTSLAGLDLDWLRNRVTRILPRDDPSRFRVAWESFVAFNEPHKVLLPLLMSAYQRAIADIGNASSMRQPASPEDRLAEHLMVYYWLGCFDFGSPDGLLDAFYSAAPDKLRGHATWFVGACVSKWDDKAPFEVLDRLRKLIERRLQSATQADALGNFVKELSNFGRWFTSEKFDERWSLETLLSILRLTKKAEGDMDVVKLLAVRCATYPVECVLCLRLMVEGDRDRWLLLGIESDAINLVRTALNSNNPEAIQAARRLVEELIARGHFGFRTLLER